MYFFTGCSGQKMPFFIPKAFEYPDHSIGEGKTFIYYDSVHNKNNYFELRTFIKGGDTVCSNLQYNDTAKVDSQIINHGKLIEIYHQLSTLNSRMYKGEDIVDMTISDGTRLGKNKQSYTFRNDDTLTVKISSESQFFKDTSILWKGALLPCLVVQTNGNIELRSKKFAGLNRSSTVLVYSYYALKIGEIKYTVAFRDRNNNDYCFQWNLTSIANGVKPFARSREQASPAPK
jgi:hypothetical protein